MDFQAYRTQVRKVLAETQAAREALEAKGAFTEANAATHIIRALEALIQVLDLKAAL